VVVGEKHEPEELAGAQVAPPSHPQTAISWVHWGITQKEYRFISGANGAVLLKWNRHE
jgi:hypothetical protein